MQKNNIYGFNILNTIQTQHNAKKVDNKINSTIMYTTISQFLNIATLD